MHVALDITPIDSKSKSQHKVRGVGKYISLLRDNIEKFDKDNSYSFTSNPQSVGADVIHYPYFDPFFITLPFRNTTRTIVTVHDLIPLVHKKEFPVGVKGMLKWKKKKKLLQRVNGIITDSIASKEDVNMVAGIDSAKIYPVHLSADQIFEKKKISDFDKKSFLNKYSLPENFFLYVGDVTWNKNLPRLIESVNTVKIPLVMVGKAIAEENFDNANAWNRDRIIVNEKTKNNPLFIKLGFISNEDLAILYNLSRGLVMPSLDEGFGLPVLEAMQSGCPVITSRCGSLAEVGGAAVEYVEVNSVDDIARGIEAVAKNKEYADILSRRGIEQAAKFTIKKMIEETVSVYNHT